MHIVCMYICIYELIEHTLIVHSLNTKYFKHLIQKISFESLAGQIWTCGANPAK